jgi:hypothetical protein
VTAGTAAATGSRDVVSGLPSRRQLRRLVRTPRQLR